MATSAVELKWEWPAGRAIDRLLLVRVDSVQPASRGLFGIKASPSMAAALPDATDVVATVDEQSPVLAGQRLKLELPGMEARKLKAGGWAALGLIEGHTVCACVEPSPADSATAARQWLPDARCR